MSDRFWYFLHCLKFDWDLDLTKRHYYTDTFQATRWTISQEAGTFTGKPLPPTLTSDWRTPPPTFRCTDGVSPVCRLTKDGSKTCLTCALGGENCQYNSAYFSHSASFYQMSCRGLLHRHKQTQETRVPNTMNSWRQFCFISTQQALEFHSTL